MTAAKVQSIAEAAATPVHIAAEKSQSILMEQLRVAPWNARKTFDAAALDELTASIQKQGLLLPLIVRPIESLKDILQHPEQAARSSCAYEIVAGHRRYRAVFKLNWKTVSCVVRDLNDDQARQIGLVDNLQREGVPALEEADAYKELQATLGTPAAIAAVVGKEVSYVARRLQLVSLAEMPRKALAERLITIDHALLLARLGVDEQDVNLKWALDHNAGMKVSIAKVIEDRIEASRGKQSWRFKWEPQSPQRLKEHIEQHVGRKLSRAPWGLDDAELVSAAGACSNCPSNTKANDTLFGDLAIDAATCENGECFENKRAQFVQIRLNEATAKQEAGHGPAVRLSWKETSVKPRFSEAKAGTILVDESGVNLMQTFKVGQWREAKPKSCAHVRLGVTVDWSDDANRGYTGYDAKLRKPGQQLAVCIAPGCKAHLKAWEKPKGVVADRGETEAERKAKEERVALAAMAETRLRVRLAGAALDKVTKLPEQLLRNLVLSQIPGGSARECFNAVLPGLEKIVRTAPLGSVNFARAVALLSIDDRWIEVWKYSPATEDRKAFIGALKLIGYDASKAWDKAAAEKLKAAPAKKERPAKKPILNAAAKKRIADAQRKRWAAATKGGKK
jgi:ParB family chromosome partitioning protein